VEKSNFVGFSVTNQKTIGKKRRFCGSFLTNFQESDMVPAKLDNEKQNLCEGPITAEECLAVLRSFQQNKTLGTDGFIH